jgi:hypothetical protein
MHGQVTRVQKDSDARVKDLSAAGLAALFTTLFVQSKHIQVMTASMVHVTNLTSPGSEYIPSRAYGKKQHQVMTASIFHVTNLTPGSECNPTQRRTTRCGGRWRRR